MNWVGLACSPWWAIICHPFTTHPHPHHHYQQQQQFHHPLRLSILHLSYSKSLRPDWFRHNNRLTHTLQTQHSQDLQPQAHCQRNHIVSTFRYSFYIRTNTITLNFSSTCSSCQTKPLFFHQNSSRIEYFLQSSQQTFNHHGGTHLDERVQGVV